LTPFQASNQTPETGVGLLRGDSSEALKKDTLAIQKAQRRLLRLKKRFGDSWLGVEKEIGVNHGHMSALVNHGTVPRSKEIRVRLGLPAVLPSERAPRRPRTRLEGSPCRGCQALKEYRAKCHH
jgi:hypothetical protein